MTQSARSKGEANPAVGRGYSKQKDEDRYKIMMGEETNGVLSQLSLVLLQRLMRGRVQECCFVADKKALNIQMGIYKSKAIILLWWK